MKILRYLRLLFVGVIFSVGHIPVTAYGHSFWAKLVTIGLTLSGLCTKSESLYTYTKAVGTTNDEIGRSGASKLDHGFMIAGISHNRTTLATDLDQGFLTDYYANGTLLSSWTFDDIDSTQGPFVEIIEDYYFLCFNRGNATYKEIVVVKADLYNPKDISWRQKLPHSEATSMTVNQAGNTTIVGHTPYGNPNMRVYRINYHGILDWDMEIYGNATTHSTSPTVDPTHYPTNSPNNDPTISPTKHPTQDPTLFPSSHPTQSPSSHPTHSPNNSPTTSPTKRPTEHPTLSPTKHPTNSPTIIPDALATSVTYALDGNAIFTGQSERNGNFDIWVIKLINDTDFDWSTEIQGVYYNEYSMGIKNFPVEDHLIISSLKVNGSHRLALMTLSSRGEEIWSLRFNQISPNQCAVTIDPQGSIHIIGDGSIISNHDRVYVKIYRNSTFAYAAYNTSDGSGKGYDIFMPDENEVICLGSIYRDATLGYDIHFSKLAVDHINTLCWTTIQTLDITNITGQFPFRPISPSRVLRMGINISSTNFSLTQKTFQQETICLSSVKLATRPTSKDSSDKPFDSFDNFINALEFSIPALALSIILLLSCIFCVYKGGFIKCWRLIWNNDKCNVYFRTHCDCLCCNKFRGDTQVLQPKTTWQKVSKIGSRLFSSNGGDNIEMTIAGAEAISAEEYVFPGDDKTIVYF